MKTKNSLLLLALSLSTFIYSCKEDDPKPPNDEELITTVELHFTEKENTHNHFVKVFRDPDGVGGAEPSQHDNIALKANTAYNFYIKVKNESNASNVVDLTEEIKEENADHQFFFVFNPPGLATHTYLDKDAGNNPVGLENSITTSATPQSGTMTVILKHKPDKKAAGVSTGNIANAGGESDVEVAFQMVIE